MSGGLSFNVFFGGVGSIAADMARYQAASPNHVLVKKSPFNVKVDAVVKSNFFFAQRQSFFRACVTPTSCHGDLGTSALFELILFYFYFSDPYTRFYLDSGIILGIF